MEVVYHFCRFVGKLMAVLCKPSHIVHILTSHLQCLLKPGTDKSVTFLHYSALLSFPGSFSLHFVDNAHALLKTPRPTNPRPRTAPLKCDIYETNRPMVLNILDASELDAFKLLSLKA